jgi:hypothetical protein
MRMHRLVRGAAIATVTAVVLAACSTSAKPDSSPGGSPSPAAGEAANRTFATEAQVIEAVKAAQDLTTLPSPVAASLAKEDNDPPKDYFDCKTVSPADNPAAANPFGQCAFGDKSGTKTMVLYGDSRAPMWTAALAGVAARNGWKLRVFALGGCPMPDLQFLSYQTNSPYIKCDQFHASAIPAIIALHPELIVTTSISDQKLADGSRPTPEQWQEGSASTYGKLAQPGTRLANLGDIPMWQNNDARCLAAHVRAVQECSAPVADATPKNHDGEKAAAAAAGALYIPTTPWICADRCEPVIADTRVYNNQYHLTQSYVIYLTGALEAALRPVLG